MSRSGGRPGRGRTRWRWVAGGVVAAAALIVGVAWWAESGGEGPGPRRMPAPIPPGMEAPSEITTVRGNPGFAELTDADRDRASRPVSPKAVEWLRTHRAVVREVARSFGVSPVALGGIVAAEKTLLVGRVDALGEELFRTVFGTLRERDLERWIAHREERYRRAAAGESRSSRFALKSPYEWTLGPAQVTFRLAVQYEPVVARRMERPERNAKEVIRAVTSPAGNLEYAAALLEESERAYRILAGMDIADNPGVLATLYHVGAPTVRARRLAAENAERRARGEPVQVPHVNYYGAFVNLHAEEIREILFGE